MDYLKDGNRVTGRSHLMLINAVASSLMGKTVLIIAANQSQSDILRDRFRKLGGDLTQARFGTTTNSNKFRGYTDDLIYRDHYADEYELRAAQDKIARLEAEKEDLRKHVLRLNIDLLKISNIAKQDIYDSDPFIFDKF